MATDELTSAITAAVLHRVTQLLTPKPSTTASAHTDRPSTIGIRVTGTPSWNDEPLVDIAGRRVHFLACPSVLAVLDALGGGYRRSTANEETSDAEPDVLVLLTDRDPDELGDAVLARLHNLRLYEVSRDTLLTDLLRTTGLDSRIRSTEHRWLVDALIAAAQADRLAMVAGTRLTLDTAIGHVLGFRLGVDIAELDLTRLIVSLDDTQTRGRWRAAPEPEQRGLAERLGLLLGRPATSVLRLAAGRDDVLGELLAADALFAARGNEPNAEARLGAFCHSRFGTEEPDTEDLRTLGVLAANIALDDDTDRARQQIRRAETMLADLNAGAMARHSRVLPAGFTFRLARAAETLDDAALRHVNEHRDAHPRSIEVRRLTAAVRLRRWLATDPTTQVVNVVDGLRRHAGELAWVDRELTQVRRGAPIISAALNDIGGRAGRARAEIDRSFARRLHSAAYPVADTVLAVENLLPAIVHPLLREHPRVLLLVLDGMSGAVAGEIADSLTIGRRRTDWTEVVRSSDGRREAVLAAFPTETTYSRTSLFCAQLRTGTAGDETIAFRDRPGMPPNTTSSLHHKAELRAAGGVDLGTDLEAALEAANTATDGQRHLVSVVLNGVDDALGKGRQSRDPEWQSHHVPALPELLERAAVDDWIVVLTSDHGHVLHHEGSKHRQSAGGGARWRPADGNPPGEDEVLLTGPRVLAPGGSAVLSTTDVHHHGPAGYGYHGGASLAEVAIPLLVLLPPGRSQLKGWATQTAGAPDWWTGRITASPVVEARPDKPAPVPRTRTPKADPGQAALFPDTEETPATTSDKAVSPSLGARLVASEVFQNVHKGLPARRVPSREKIKAVIDALSAAGDRLPVAAVLQAADAAGRNPRGFIATLQRVLNIDGFDVITLIDDGRTVSLNARLLVEQFPPGEM